MLSGYYVLLVLASFFVSALVVDHYEQLKKEGTELTEDLKSTLIGRMIFTLTMVVLVMLVGQFADVAGYSLNFREQVVTAFIVGFSLTFSSYVESKLKLAGVI